ncbi:acyl carrier protein [Streptomyces sp. NPDC006798]|uniref:acyl carrier protein n=1 Tax=Streptomyces sp. NPDC006798 TaxID=3155462 RepID=UPI0034004FB3
MTTNGTAGTASPDAADVQKELIVFLEAKTNQPIAPDQDIFAEGLATSLFAMELVVHLETVHGIEIEGPDLRLANFSTVEKMVALTLRLKGAGGAETRD